MKLDAYDVVISISVPGEPETEVEMVLRDVPREKLQNTKFPLNGLLEMLEESVDDGQ
jgi:hypothetical protein